MNIVISNNIRIVVDNPIFGGAWLMTASSFHHFAIIHDKIWIIGRPNAFGDQMFNLILVQNVGNHASNSTTRVVVGRRSFNFIVIIIVFVVDSFDNNIVVAFEPDEFTKLGG